MRTINDLYDLGVFILRKERGVMWTIPNFNLNLDSGQLDALMEYFKEYGINQQIHDALRVFKVYQPFTSTSAGFVTYPSDYLHLLGTPFTVTGSSVREVKFVQEDELPFALTSQLRAVTTSNPIAVDTSTGFSLYPQSQQVGAYFYLKRPDVPELAYTQSGRVITYDAASSTQLEWEEIYWNNILAKALKYAGVNMDERGISDFANQYNQETK